MGPEAIIERKTCRQALKLGVRNLKLNVKGQTGWPDRMFLIPGGRVLFVEFKAPGMFLSPKQKYIHQVLKKIGYKVKVYDDADRAIREITRVVEATCIPEKGGKVSDRARSWRTVP